MTEGRSNETPMMRTETMAGVALIERIRAGIVRRARRRIRVPHVRDLLTAAATRMLPPSITAHIARAFEAAILDWAADRVPDAFHTWKLFLDLTFQGAVGRSGPALQHRVTGVSWRPDATTNEPAVPGAGATDEPHR